RDLKSSNGTWVNECRIAQPTRLHDGDRIRFGDFTVQFAVSADNPLPAVPLPRDYDWLMLEPTESERRALEDSEVPTDTLVMNNPTARVLAGELLKRGRKPG